MCFLNLLAVIGVGTIRGAKMADTWEASAMPQVGAAARALVPNGYADPDAPEVGGQVGTTGYHAPRSHFLWLILKGYQREHTVDTLRRAPSRGARTRPR